MRKSDKDFIIEKLSEIHGLVVLNRGNKSVYLTSMSYGLDIEVHDHLKGQQLEKYSTDSIEYVIDSLISKFKGYKVNYEMCI